MYHNVSWANDFCFTFLVNYLKFCLRESSIRLTVYFVLNIFAKFLRALTGKITFDANFISRVL